MADWQVGDKVVCVDETDSTLVQGAIYPVLSVGAAPVSGRACLQVRPVEGRWYSDRFRKVVHDKHEGEAEDWQLLLDSMKRTVRA